MGRGVRDHRELDAWKLADQARQGVRELTSHAGFRDHTWLRLQLQRAANSACANIAEGFARYRPRDFVRFLRIANGSLTEVLDHLSEAVGLGLLSVPEIEDACGHARRARGATTRLIRYLLSAEPPPVSRDDSRR